jgi:hypothetical protein
MDSCGTSRVHQLTNGPVRAGTVYLDPIAVDPYDPINAAAEAESASTLQLQQVYEVDASYLAASLGKQNVLGSGGIVTVNQSHCDKAVKSVACANLILKAVAGDNAFRRKMRQHRFN